MAEAAIAAIKRIAVVTGGNKGIGLEICRQLASKGVLVVLTARDEKRGLDAVDNLKASAAGPSDIVFHQLDVMDSVSIASFAEFIRTQFGRLDILVNNAGVTGSVIKPEDRENIKYDQIFGPDAGEQKKYFKQTYETANCCLKTNYYGIKQLSEVLIPVLQQSSSARIVNVTSSLGQLRMISNEKARMELGDVDRLTEEKVDKLLDEFLEDVKKDTIETKGWPTLLSAYMVSKAVLNAYTRIMAKKYPKIAINAVCPGHTRTDLTNNTGTLTVEEGARGPVMVALMTEGSGPSGCFFQQTEMSSFF